MNQSKMFLSIKDLQRLMGTAWYSTAARRHRAFRNEIMPGKKDLTIKEYCELTGSNYRLTYMALRGEPPS